MRKIIGMFLLLFMFQVTPGMAALTSEEETKVRQWLFEKETLEEVSRLRSDLRALEESEEAEIRQATQDFETALKSIKGNYRTLIQNKRLEIENAENNLP